jgi:hypothetical protein
LEYEQPRRITLHSTALRQEFNRILRARRRLSITYNFGTEHGAQRDVGQPRTGVKNLIGTGLNDTTVARGSEPPEPAIVDRAVRSEALNPSTLTFRSYAH